MQTLNHEESEIDLSSFHENGFAGPFTLCTPDEMASFRTRIEKEVLATTNQIYGFDKAIGRDRHLDSRAVYDLIMNPYITQILSRILGDDLMVWRSTFFFKPPGAPETVWHSANVFREFTDHPILEPPDPNDFFQVTTWIAIDEANDENGPVQLVAGSHRTTRSVGRSDEARSKAAAGDSAFGADQKGFFGYDLNPDFEIEESKIHTMHCKPGQFFVFDQRTLHGSPPNNSPNRRLAFNFRTVRSDVKVYRHFLEAGKIDHYGESWDLTGWGCIPLSGKNVADNKIGNPPTPEKHE